MKSILSKTSIYVPTTDMKLIEEHQWLGLNRQSCNINCPYDCNSKWSEPFQTPEFEEYTYIIKGKSSLLLKT
jgi:hypothetical protein